MERIVTFSCCIFLFAAGCDRDVESIDPSTVDLSTLSSLSPEELERHDKGTDKSINDLMEQHNNLIKFVDANIPIAAWLLQKGFDDWYKTALFFGNGMADNNMFHCKEYLERLKQNTSIEYKCALAGENQVGQPD